MINYIWNKIKNFFKPEKQDPHIVLYEEVKPEHCNIRQMPEDANCLDIITASSKIDHIKLIKK